MGRLAAAWAALRAGEMKQGPIVTTISAGVPVKNMQRFENQAKDGYAKNVVVYRCVNLIAQNAASVPFRIFRGGKTGEELEEHPILELLNRPNPMQSASEYFEAVYGFAALNGNTFQTRVGPDNEPPRELWTLRPDRIEIKPGRSAIPASYVYKVDGQVIATYEVDELTGQSALKHTKLWNPLSDFWGMSPLAPAALKTDTHNSAGLHNLNLIRHGGSPSSAVIHKPVDAQGNPVRLTEEQRQRVISDIQSRMAGEGNAGRILFLEGDFDWKSIGLSPKDMDWSALEGMSAKDIAQAFDVPPQLIGVEGSLTFANYEQARLALWEDGIIPRMRRVLTDLNEWLAPAFGEDLMLDYDWNSIPALVERKKALIEMAERGVNAGLMKIDEGRELIGLEPLDDDAGDVVLINAGRIPLTEGGGGDDGTGTGNGDGTEDETEEERQIALGDVVELHKLAYGND